MNPDLVRILLADSSKSNYLKIKNDLLRNGNHAIGKFEINFAREGRDALRLLNERKYDVCLVNHHLVDTSGVGLLKKIYAENFKTPIIYLINDIKFQSFFKLAQQYGAVECFILDHINADRLTNSILRILKEFELQKRNEFYAKALETIGESVIITDIDGNIKYTNNFFTLLTGFSNSEVLGKKPSLWKSDRHGKEFYQGMWETVLSGKLWKGEVTNRKKNGMLYEADLTITPLIERGKIEGLLSVHADITAHKRLERELQISNTKLKEAIKETQYLTSFIAHDLRASLNNIIKCEELLEKSELNSEQKGYVENLVSSSMHMQEMVTDFFDICKSDRT